MNNCGIDSLFSPKVKYTESVSITTGKCSKAIAAIDRGNGNQFGSFVTLTTVLNLRIIGKSFPTVSKLFKNFDNDERQIFWSRNGGPGTTTRQRPTFKNNWHFIDCGLQSSGRLLVRGLRMTIDEIRMLALELSPIPDGVEVIRVLHAARNIRNLDRSESREGPVPVSASWQRSASSVDLSDQF